jgi:serine/threonine-protein kinase
MTSDGGVLGTAEYMAPEQADGRAVTDRADQYSLGGVMFALLAGRPPFRASSFVEMLQMQRFSEPQPVRRYAPDTPAELDRIIAQLLEKDPAKRFVNTMMLARAIEAMEKGLSLSSARDDFVIADPKRTMQPHLTGLDPYAATLVPSEQSMDDPGYSLAAEPVGTIIHTGDAIAPSEVSRAPAAPTRFTRVTERQDEEATWYEELLRGLLSAQTLATLGALVLVVTGVVYLLKPKSADKLYEQISAEIGDGELEQLRMAGPKIDEFLDRFPDDTRAAELREYQQQLALSRRARLAKIAARVPGKRQMSSPIERAYVEASTLAEQDPEAAATKLRAIVDLYGDAPLEEADGRDFVEIARQDLVRLQDDLRAGAADQLRLLETRMVAAEKLASDDPAGARRIWQGIIDLYGGKPWAAAIIVKARQSLANLPPKP